MPGAVKAYEGESWKAVDVDRGGRPVGKGRTLSVKQEVIAACANVEGAENNCGDETGLRMDEVGERNYAPQGQTPVIRVQQQTPRLVGDLHISIKGQMSSKTFAVP